MAKYARWIGGALGWAIGGPIGAVLGIFGGMMFEESTAQTGNTKSRGERYNTGSGDFAASLLVLSAAVMKADDKILKSELNFVKKFYVDNFGEEVAEHHIKLLKELLKTELRTIEVSRQIRHFMQHSNRLLLMQYLFGIAQADGNIDPRELSVLRTICVNMGISMRDFESIKAMFMGYSRSSSSNSRTRSTTYTSQSKIDAAYKILEIESSVDDAEVKKAYRRMARKYHPDKNRNVGESYMKLAEENFIKVQEAYELIKDKRGMK